MSVDYRIKIFRKVDDKLLGVCYANQLKAILDSEFAEIINCDRCNCDKAKFTYNDLEALSTAVFGKMKELNNKIAEKKLMLAIAHSVDVKHELEEEIFSIKEELEELRWPFENASKLQGMLDCVVEDLWDKEDKHPAHEYNSFDLPEKTVVYANGDKETLTPTVWCKDVYCVVEANY